MGASQKGCWLALVGTILITVFLPSLSLAYNGTITETFANNQYNTSLWRLAQDLGTGATAQVTNNRLEVTVAGYGAITFNSNHGFTLIGDYEILIDFTLINWPENNATKVGLGTSLAHETDTIWPSVERANAPWDTQNGPEVYYTSMTYFQDVKLTGPTSSGTLRLVRTGNKVDGFYWNGSAWQSAGAGTDASYGARVAVNMWICPNGHTYSGISAKAAISNIRVNYTTLGPSFYQVNPGIMQLLLD